MKRALVCGAGGFIGGHLTLDLLLRGYLVTATDIKPLSEWSQVHADARCIPERDLNHPDNAYHVMMGGYDEVYNLAANMGGMGYIETHKLECMLNSRISVNVLEAARHSRHGVGRFFYSSSACVYKADAQDTPDAVALREEDAYPAMPEDGYGWEKLFSERLAMHYNEETDMEVRVARYHNVYGTHTAWVGGREKAPAAICRKVAEAALTGEHEIEIWGDGEQTRSFMFQDDCTYGTQMILLSDIDFPINLGSSEAVTINELVSIAEDIAGVTLDRTYKLDAPKGVRGRNSDNTLIQREFGWEPSVSLREGMERTYAWVHDKVKNA